jgi:SAM-dependent methyltransferase
MTRALAHRFGEVHAVDISAEMIALARQNLSGLRNVFLYKNNGRDLAEIPDKSCDFAFSFIVFQHIPNRGVVESYVREVHRCLEPGSLFKFQVQGDTAIESTEDDTWVGAPMSLADAQALATRCGFELIRSSGKGTQYFWLWFRKPGSPWLDALTRATEALRFWCANPVAVTFSPRTVRPGETYRVRIPEFAGRVIDVGYELAPVSGVVSKWCELDSRGEARISLPPEHPAGIVRIAKIRSRNNNGRWRRARGTIQVVAVDG